MRLPLKGEEPVVTLRTSDGAKHVIRARGESLGDNVTQAVETLTARGLSVEIESEGGRFRVSWVSTAELDEREARATRRAS